jgi:hypothetical protein
MATAGLATDMKDGSKPAASGESPALPGVGGSSGAGLRPGSR